MWKCTKCQTENQDTSTACAACAAIRPTARFNNPAGRPGAAYDAQSPSAFAPPAYGQDAPPSYGRPAQTEGAQPDTQVISRRARAQAAAMPRRASDDGYGDAPAPSAPADARNVPENHPMPDARRAPDEFRAPDTRYAPDARRAPVGYNGAPTQRPASAPRPTTQNRVQRTPPPQERRFSQDSESEQKAPRKSGWVAMWLTVCGYTLLAVMLIVPALLCVLNIDSIQLFFVVLAETAGLPTFAGYIAMGLSALLGLVLCTLPGTLVLAVSKNLKK